MGFWYPHAAHEIGLGTYNLGTAVIRTLLVLTGTSALTDDANRDVTNVAAFTTLNEHPSALRVTLSNQSYDKDAANNRSELTADPSVFSSLPNTGSDVVAAISYLFGTSDADSPPMWAADDNGFPFTPTGSDNTITWDAEGAVQITTPAT